MIGFREAVAESYIVLGIIREFQSPNSVLSVSFLVKTDFQWVHQ